MSIAVPAAASADVHCLAEVFSHVPDPRSAKGRRDGTCALLSLAVLALLRWEKGVQGIGRFARDLPKVPPDLGFTPPHQGRVVARRGTITPVRRRRRLLPQDGGAAARSRCANCGSTL